MFMKIAILAILATAISAYPQAQCASGRTYTVQPGDTCNGISGQQNVPLFQLTSANTGLNCNNLLAGQSLCLADVGQDCTDVHVVGMNENCASIAMDAHIPLTTLFANNGNINDPSCNNIGVGDVLCVASTLIQYGA